MVSATLACWSTITTQSHVQLMYLVRCIYAVSTELQAINFCEFFTSDLTQSHTHHTRRSFHTIPGFFTINLRSAYSFFFFLNNPPPPEIYPLPQHDPLPI